MKAKRLRHIALSLVGATIVAYFLYHTVQGERGLFALLHLRGQLGQSEETLKELQAQSEALEHKVQRLRPHSIDPDLLDQEARRSLNYSKPKEVIIINPDKSNQK